MASVAMLAWMARPLFAREVPLSGDLLVFHYPLRDFYARALADGHPFDWMPSLFAGFYVVGEGQLGAYHPFHWLLYRTLPVDTAFVVEVIASYPFLFAGAWLFLRRYCGSAPAAFGAMLATFSGFTLAHGVHVNMVAVASHIPWLLWAIHGAIAATDWHGRARSVAAIGLLTGSQLALGHPQTVWLSLLIETAYILFLSTTASSRLRGLGVVAAGKVLGTAIGAVQLLATFHAAENSVRAVYNESFSTSYPLPPSHLIQFINPYSVWGRVTSWTTLLEAGDELAAYAGAVTLVLSSWFLSFYPRLRAQGLATAADRFGVFAYVFGLLGIWLATGERGGLYMLQTWLPLVRLFRVPARYLLFTHLAFAAAAAVALMRLLRVEARSRQTPLWVPWTLASASVVSAIWTLNDRSAASPEAVAAATIGAALFVGAAGLLTLATRGAKAAIAGLVLLAACDHALYGLGGVEAWHDHGTHKSLLELDDAPPAANGRLVAYGSPNRYVLGGYRMLNGYAGLTPAKVLDYSLPEALRVAQVGYIQDRILQETPLRGAERWSRGWHRLPDALPRARLVSTVRASHQPVIDLGRIDIERTALVSRELELPAGTAGVAEIVEDGPGDIRIRTTATTRQLLVVSESYDAGWTATIDGRPAPVERVNGDFVGSVVEPGEHLVLLQFRPAHLAWGKAISLCGLAVALALIGLSRPRLPRALATRLRRSPSPR